MPKPRLYKSHPYSFNIHTINVICVILKSSMRRATKLKIIVPIVACMFIGAYIWHKRTQKENTITGYLESREMDETSGVAASGINEDIYYIHNDSGDTSRFFAIKPTGELINTLYFKGDKKTKYGVEDCEDIAVGPGPVPGKSYVYLGDIGDNSSDRKYITVYRFEEQTAWGESNEAHNISGVSINFKYPDGPKDAETLMIDPLEKLIYIVTKRRDSVKVYTSPLIFKPNDTLMLTKRATLYFSGYKPFKWITAGDISKDGTQVLLKNYEKVYYWQREPGEHIWQTLLRKPHLLPYAMERQGEGIGFTPDGKGYYCVSEGVFTPIYYYNITN